MSPKSVPGHYYYYYYYYLKLFSFFFFLGGGERGGVSATDVTVYPQTDLFVTCKEEEKKNRCQNQPLNYCITSCALNSAHYNIKVIFD